MTPEDMLDPTPDMSGTQSDLVRADLVFFETAERRGGLLDRLDRLGRGHGVERLCERGGAPDPQCPSALRLAGALSSHLPQEL